MTFWQTILKLGRAGGLVFGALLLFILFKAFQPAGSAGSGGLFPWDKADHFCAFFVLGGVALVAFPRQPLWRIATGMAALGALIEVIQGLPFVNRDCDFWDWVAEMCALSALYGTILAARIRRTLAGDTDAAVKRAAE